MKKPVFFHLLSIMYTIFKNLHISPYFSFLQVSYLIDFPTLTVSNVWHCIVVWRYYKTLLHCLVIEFIVIENIQPYTIEMEDQLSMLRFPSFKASWPSRSPRNYSTMPPTLSLMPCDLWAFLLITVIALMRISPFLTVLL